MSCSGSSALLPRGQYSIDKYFQREHLAFEFSGRFYEVRLLTVLSPHRGRLVAPVLMYAALCYVESHGGSQLVAIGRREVLDLYTKCGMKALASQPKPAQCNTS